MPLPASWKTLTVPNTYLQPNGAPAVGSVQFIAQRAIGMDDTVVLPHPITAAVNGSGTISASLPCPDDAEAGFTSLIYLVRERTQYGRAEFYIQVDNSMDSPINLEAIPRVAPLEEDQQWANTAQAWSAAAAASQAAASASAATATTQAGNASASAASATASEVAADTSEANAAASAAAALVSSATAEAAAGPTYASKALGEAATTAGQSFAVDNGDGTVSVYLRTGGGSTLQRTLATTAALAAATGGAMVKTQAPGAGSVPRTLEAKVREIGISPDDKGAVGDGVADDTAAVHAAITEAITRGVPIIGVPGKKYRCTSGFVNGGIRANLFFKGPGRINERATDAKSAVFILDSTDPASFFLQLTRSCTLKVEGVHFACAQYVQDRKFIRMGGGLNPLVGWFLQGVAFDNVEKPICLEPGLYFQNAALRDVCFNNSGTIHSEGDASGDNLIGTYLLLDNVNHEGSVPANTEKQVCNLQAIRLIIADNLLMEGSLPAAGWTVLKLANPYDSYYARSKFAHLRNFHSEWVGNQPTYVIDQQGGTIETDYLVGLSTGSKYRVTDMGKAIVHGTDFSATADDPALFFDLADGHCLVEFDRCTARAFDLSRRGFTHHLTQTASVTDGIGQTHLSNTGSRELWRWGGEIVSAGGDVLCFPAAPFLPSTDATVGRKMVFSTGAAINSQIQVKHHGAVQTGDQVFIAGRLQLPTFTGGNFQVSLLANGAGVAGAILTYTTAYSGQLVDFAIPYVRKAADTFTQFGFGIVSNALAGAVGNAEVHSLVIGYGRTLPRVQATAYPRCVISYGTAAPTTGTHAVGDIVINANPSVGQPKAWRCTNASGSGTWVSEGNL